ncbi:hypothetical protein DM01DRAFT_1298864 [Hesseltinella vesiculosa]|uniref:Arrestin-like N-terminal domain-containing protein n=1 Tax=Hesseltinella vesiculosa TaxID=101127 RepID=A0A1X2GW50_9FUNG|nr:hypothetical protein DM01DRAFT_1298864 [Hesseltinella vesiculosa]
MGLLSHDRLTFGPLKPVILRGAPDVDASSVLTSFLCLTLAKPEKISNVKVYLKSTSKTYWPEGLGQKAKQVTHSQVLNTKTLTLLDEKTMLSAGEHRWPFTFIIPNSTIDTIESEYGRVKHTVEAIVTRTGKPLLIPDYRLSKSILILRSYMSDDLLVSNSIRDLSQTFERHLPAGDVSVMVEYSAFSSGDLYNLQFVIQPQQKDCRLESIQVSVTETRRYVVPELGAWRNDSHTFPLQYAYATPLGEADSLCHAYIHDDDMIRVFDTANASSSPPTNGTHGLPLVDTFGYRVAFATPTCQDKFHHSTHYREIGIRHTLSIHVTLSHADPSGIASPPSTPASPSSPMTGPAQLQPPTWPSVVSRLRKGKKQHDANRQLDHIKLDLPLTVFDCRLKEDYSHLPSYFETGLVESPFTTIMPGDQPRHHAFLCPCYHEFCRQMEQTSALLNIPSIPPPDYEHCADRKVK